MHMTTAKPIKNLVENYQPQKNTETQIPPHISELWAVMAEIFGKRWTSQQPKTPSLGWLGVLQDLSVADVGAGILKLRDSAKEWPPSATEFRAMCKQKRENAGMYSLPPERQLPHKLSDDDRAKGRAHIAEAKKLCS